MATTRSVHDEIKNALDFLLDAELALYVNPVSIAHSRVAWHGFGPTSFLLSRHHPDVNQYVAWLSAGEYSAVLFDASLLQITYDITGGRVIGHRLLYFPCPYDLDRVMLAEGHPLVDVVDLYRDTEARLHSPIRFDYDPRSAGTAHPASHFTMNGVDCRVACVAPLHVMRFLDFVFSSFYPDLRAAHAGFFKSATSSHAGDPTVVDDHRRGIHMAWDVHATATGGALER